ncbi:MAG: metallophosphoesterase [Desulfurococcaceae archaeon]
MKILALSDIHERTGKLRSLNTRLKELEFKPDLVVVAGDLTYFKDIKIAINILREIKEILDSVVVFIPGNCDPPSLIDVKGIYDNIVNIHGETFIFQHYTLFGIGGSGLTPFNTFIEYSEEEFKEFFKKIISIDHGDGLIVITHQPIRNFFDKVGDVHVGSVVFLEALNKLKPMLWITGHIHEHSGWIKHGNTVIVHPGPFMRGYYGIIEITGRDINLVNTERVKERK